MLETVLPQNDLVKKYVRYIYQFSTDDPGFKRQLLIFPNVGSAITIYKDVDFVAVNDQEFLSPEKQGNSGVVLQMNRIDPVSIKEEGRQKRVVVVLKPLGINQFISEAPGELLKNTNPTLIPATHLFGELKELIEMNQPLQKTAPAIEELLAKKFKAFTNTAVEEAINEISKADRLSKVEDIARRVGTSPKTMERLFLKYIGLSPVAFRKILQFRNALSNKLANPGASYRTIAWENNYYDLPYMIKVFREMTGISMTEFFNKLSYSVDKQYVYIG